jgi:hypothetical protein
MTNAGDIYQNVYNTNFANCASTIGFVADIEVKELSADALRDRLAVGFVTIGYPDCGARFGKNFGDGSADTGRSASDKSDFRFETEHDLSFRVSAGELLTAASSASFERLNEIEPCISLHFFCKIGRNHSY